MSRKPSRSLPSQFGHCHFLLDLKRIQNPEYSEALNAIRPLVEQNLISLTKNELPFEDAFRVTKKNIDVTPRQISYVNNMFKIPPSIIPPPEVSCLLHHLYPEWYAANRNTAFIYIPPELNKTHYKRIPLASFGNLRFLRLHLPINELKSSFGFIGKEAKTWSEVMITPPNILEILRTISTVDDLSNFIDKMVKLDNPNPIDATFIQEFNEACDRLNVTDEKEYYNIATKISLCGKFYTEGEFSRTNWYKKSI